MSSSGTTTTVDRPLWLTVPGASARVAGGWLAWVMLAAAGARLLAASIGPAGAALALFVGGWALALACPAPSAWLRRYHLDDVEAVVMGPGARVRRLPWTLVDTVRQTADGLVLAGAGVDVELRLAPLLRAEEWATVLARVVPDLATEIWERIEDGEEVRLAAAADPSTRRLVWWCWVPAAIACAIATGAAGAALLVGAAISERAVSLGVARLRGVRLDRSGIRLRRGWRGWTVPWSRADVARAEGGVAVRDGSGDAALVRLGVANFWVALPVIELRARLGFHCPPVVAFRVRRADGGLAVVGEVDGAA